MRPGAAVAAVSAAVLLLLPAGRAHAQRVEVEADAIARARPATGLLVLRSDAATEQVDAEALVWGGWRDDAPVGEALVAVVRARDPTGRAQLRLGRMILLSGGLRPLHLDGADGTLRLPGALTLQAFAGVPVAPEAQGRGLDWAAGGRIGRALGEWGSFGVAYLHRRDHGALADEELAFDAGAAIGREVEVAARVSLDLIELGPSEAQASVALTDGAWRVELFGVERSPSRILPATSLFTVLGDLPSARAGTSIRWRAAPRLDLGTTLAARIAAGEPGESLLARARLRLDDEGKGALLGEVVREGVPDAAWTGVRAALTVPLAARWSTAIELELAAPDEPGDRGDLWPWALLALTFRPTDAWEIAAAMQAGATPEHASELDALLRVSHRSEVSW